MNVAANLGYNTMNVAAAGTYGFNPLSRNRSLLEWSYRGSWLIRKIVDAPADDMTREGITIEGDMPPDQIDEFMQYWASLQIWQRLNDTLKWSRLYGGCIAVIIIDGQDLATPLRLDTIGKGQFKGLLVLDRWMVTPGSDAVESLGEDHGKPTIYQVVTLNNTRYADAKVHHSRCIRFDGIALPYWQSQTENGWGLSIVEPIWDRLLAFDSSTQGAAQLVYKAHLRVLKLPQYRDLVASGGPLFQAVMRQLQMIRVMQTNEGLTVIDADDQFEVNSYAFSGLSELLTQFGQQVSGAADVPMTRLYGQSPAGMNSTGESDLRNYYDALKSNQEFRLRRPIKVLCDIAHRSLYGTAVPKGFSFKFNPLWQLTEEAKAGIASQTAASVDQLLQGGVFTPAIAMKEIRQSSRVTGFGSNITDEDITAAENQPPPGDPGMMGDPNAQPEAGDPASAAPGPMQGQEQGAGVMNETEPPSQSPLPMNSFGGMSGMTSGGAAEALPDVPPPANDPADRDHFAHLLRLAAKIRSKRRRTRATDVRAITLDPKPPIHQYPGLMTHVNVGGARINIGDTATTVDGMPSVDCIVGPDTECEKVFLVEQIDPATMRFDQYKAVLGITDRTEAIVACDPARVGHVQEMSVDEFRSFLQTWKPGDKPKRGNGYDSSRDALGS